MGRFKSALPVEPLSLLRRHCPGCGMPSQSSLRDASSPKGGAIGRPGHFLLDAESPIWRKRAGLATEGSGFWTSAPCQAVAGLDSGALPFPRHRALLVQTKADRHARGSPSGGAGAKRLRGQGRSRRGFVYGSVETRQKNNKYQKLPNDKSKHFLTKRHGFSPFDRANRLQ